MGKRFRMVILVLNTLGFVGYLVWMALFGGTNLYRRQEGALYLVLPLLPFLFVYLAMNSGKKKDVQPPASPGS